MATTFYIVSNIFFTILLPLNTEHMQLSETLSPTKIAALLIKLFICISHLSQYFALWQSSCEQPLQTLYCLSVCVIVCSHRTKQLPPDEFSLGCLLKSTDMLRL